MERISQIPTLRDELVPTGTSTLPFMDELKREYDGLNQEIGRLQDALDTLVRLQRKYVRLFLMQPCICNSASNERDVVTVHGQFFNTLSAQKFFYNLLYNVFK